MTTSNVTQIGLYPINTQSTGQASGIQTDDFSKVFASQSSQTEHKMTNKQEPKEKVTDPSEKEKVTDTPDAKDDTSIRDNTQTDKTQRTEETSDVKETTQTENVAETQEDEPDMETVMEAIAQIMTVIGENLMVTPEQIQSAMDELGISPQDLLNAEMIPQLVVALTEGADELSVMTDAELFADIQKITAEVNGILEELSDQMKVTPDQLKEMLQNMTKEENPTEETLRPLHTDNTSDIPLTEESRVQIPLESVTDSFTKEEGSKEDMAGTQEHQMSFAQTVAEQIEQAVSKMETSDPSYTQTQNIMDQIQDMIKVIRTEDMTEMELQLHPASLGHVKVQIAMTEGALTATFTTQNEAVKAVLESQMLVLKENFEQQGIKVEAVEVTVASHAFEQNLNNSENAAKEEQEPEKKKSIRKISLNDLLSETTEELSDEDRIVAEMMKQNGNTVDYTV